MRAIKFRFWNTRTGKFEEESDLFFVRGDGVICSNDSVENNLEAEQYTGLKDKNDKEIYEGDIVRCWIELSPILGGGKYCKVSKVEWLESDNPEWPYDKVIGFMFEESCDGYEVIGNIHENPELLGGKE